MDIIQDTKELVTPSGDHTILVKAYLTGEDRRANRRTILKIAEEGQGNKVEGIEEAENSLIKQIVLEIDGDKENIVERILKFRASDYDFIVETVNDVSRGMDEKKKVKSDGSTTASSTEQK